MVGQKPYQGIENFKQSSSLSRPRFLYYQQKREKEPLYHLNAASYGWLHAAAHLYRDLMRSGWKRIEAPVLLFQAENDHLVSNRAQERMIRKMAERRPGMAKMVKVPAQSMNCLEPEGACSRRTGIWYLLFWKKICNKREGMTK